MRITSDRASLPERSAPPLVEASSAPPAATPPATHQGRTVDSSDELSESELEVVVGGLTRTIGELPTPEQTAWRLI